MLKEFLLTAGIMVGVLAVPHECGAGTTDVGAVCLEIGTGTDAPAGNTGCSVNGVC